MPDQNESSFNELAVLSHELEKEYSDLEKQKVWKGSPFEWIVGKPSRQVGKIGELLVEGWCSKKGFHVSHTGDTEADRIIAGRRVEIKFSTLWQAKVYTFQQIRDEDYEFLVCLGVSPSDAHVWIIPKEILYKYVIGHTPQHKGKEGNDTFWISFCPEIPPNWLKEFGGELSKAEAILRRIARNV